MTEKRVRDLPPGRLENVVWHFAYRQGLSLDTPLVRLHGPRCMPTPREALATEAIRADDGFFHLWNAGRIRCRHHTITSSVGLTLMRLRPNLEATENESGYFEWFPSPLDGETAPAIEVPIDDQCPSGRTVWPGTIVGRGKLIAVRRRLVDEFGPHCMCCRVELASVVDHDHRSGLIRGYLCRDCNGAVDRCWHQNDCAYAEYLASAPALGLGLIHPDAARWLKQPKYVARRREYERVMAGGVSEGVGLQDPDWVAYLTGRTNSLGGTTGAQSDPEPDNKKPQAGEHGS